MRPETTAKREEIVIRLVIELTGASPRVNVAPMTPALSLVGGTEALSPAHVTSIEHARDSWLTHMESRGKKPASVRQFRTVFDKARRECGWVTPADFTFASVTSWMARAGEAASWSPATVRRNLAVFKGFSRYAAAAELLPRDVLTLAVGPDGDGGPGARAATLDEARAIIRHALLREEADRRARSARSLYWLLLFGAGLRFNEPKGLLWSDLHLDAPIPFILWRPEQHKNRKRMETALSPEVAGALCHASSRFVTGIRLMPASRGLPQGPRLVLDRRGRPPWPGILAALRAEVLCHDTDRAGGACAGDRHAHAAHVGRAGPVRGPAARRASPSAATVSEITSRFFWLPLDKGPPNAR